MAKEGQGPFDLWSLLHFSAGVGMGLLQVPWFGMLALTVGYEGFEAGLREGRTSKGGIFAAESWVNMVVDILVAATGWGLALLALWFWHK